MDRTNHRGKGDDFSKFMLPDPGTEGCHRVVCFQGDSRTSIVRRSPGKAIPDHGMQRRDALSAEAIRFPVNVVADACGNPGWGKCCQWSDFRGKIIRMQPEPGAIAGMAGGRRILRQRLSARSRGVFRQTGDHSSIGDSFHASFIPLDVTRRIFLDI